MLIVAILAAVVCVALSAPPTCEERNYGCNTDQVKSFPYTDAMKAEGKGRQAMQQLIRMKNTANAARDLCQSGVTCPGYQAPKSITGARVDCVDGQAGEYECSNVDLLSFLSFADLGYPEGGVGGNDLWVWHDTETGDDYVIMGVNDGSSFVRVTDRVNPEVIGILRSHDNIRSSWRDMKVVGNFAYIVSEATFHGMQVFDLTRLRGLAADNTRVFEVDVHYDRVGNTHNIVANEATNRVFLVGSTQGDTFVCDGGLHIVDVSDPMNPRFETCYGGDGYVHDAECIVYDGPDTRYTGQEICFCYNEDTFTIVDVTDASNVTLLGRKGYEGSAYSHQGWCTEDRMFALLDDELDELVSTDRRTTTFVWDIQDLTDPILVNTHIAPQESSDHNMYIKGNYAHQSNYMSGYRLMALDNLPELSEVAFFDVYPPSTQAGFDGTWSNYPYFSDDAVAVSSITYGLFMVQPNFPAIESCRAKPTAQC